jgi:hypothetical protein
MMMDRRSIAEMLAEIRLHGGQNLGQDRRGSVIVEVDAAHNILSILRFRVGGRRGSLLILAVGLAAGKIRQPRPIVTPV